MNWRDLLHPIGGTLVVLALAMLLLYPLSRALEERPNEPQESAETGEQSGQVPAPAFDCSKEETRSEKARCERDNADLDAQESMAESAGWAAIFAGAALVISCFGTIAIWVSLMQTRETIKNNREIGETQARAYLSVPAAEIIFHPTGRFGINLHIKNSGASPARGVEAIVHPTNFLRTTRDEAGMETAAGQVAPDGTPEVTQVGDISPSEVLDNVAAQAPKPDIPQRSSFNAFVCKVTLNYRTVFFKAGDPRESMDLVLIGVGLNIPEEITSNIRVGLMVRSVGTLFREMRQHRA